MIEKIMSWANKLQGRFVIYTILIVGIGVGFVFWFLASHSPLADANPFDIATFLLVVAGAVIALVAQEISGRVQISGFRRAWTEDLRDLLARLLSLEKKFNRATGEAKDSLGDEMINCSAKILLMLTDLRANNNPQHPHALLESQVKAILGRCNVNIEDVFVVAARPVLKEGWMQTVDEVRLR